MCRLDDVASRDLKKVMRRKDLTARRCAAADDDDLPNTARVQVTSP